MLVKMVLHHQWKWLNSTETEKAAAAARRCAAATTAAATRPFTCWRRQMPRDFFFQMKLYVRTCKTMEWHPFWSSFITYFYPPAFSQDILGFVWMDTFREGWVSIPIGIYSYVLSILGHATPRLFLDLVFEYIHNTVKVTLIKRWLSCIRVRFQKWLYSIVCNKDDDILRRRDIARKWAAMFSIYATSYAGSVSG